MGGGWGHLYVDMPLPRPPAPADLACLCPLPPHAAPYRAVPHRTAASRCSRPCWPCWAAWRRGASPAARRTPPACWPSPAWLPPACSPTGSKCRRVERSAAALPPSRTRPAFAGALLLPAALPLAPTCASSPARTLTSLCSCRRRWAALDPILFSAAGRAAPRRPSRPRAAPSAWTPPSTRRRASRAGPRVRCGGVGVGGCGRVAGGVVS